MNKIKNQRGFTLIELIIVIVILGVLAGLAGPKLIGSIKDAKASTVISNIQQIERTASVLFAQDQQTAPDQAAILAKLNKDIGQMGFSKIETKMNTTDNTQLDITIEFTPAAAGVIIGDLTPFAKGSGTSTTKTKLTGTFTQGSGGATGTITYKNTIN